MIDPIDGTRSFIRGVPLYAVLIAMVDAEGPQLGVIHFPGLGETLRAYRGGGCTWNGRSARVSEEDRLDRALVLSSDRLPRSHEGLLSDGATFRTWGDAYGYALVATGRAEVMVDPVARVWDLAAVVPIIEEAGGRFTDLRGSRTAEGGHGIATNGKLHDEALRRLGA